MTLPIALPTPGDTNWTDWATAIDTAARSSAFLDVDGKFGGGWAGVILACNEAVASGGPSAVVQLGKGIYDATSTIEITRPDLPFTIQGAGIRGTRLRHSGTFKAELFRVTNMKRSGEWEGSSGPAPGLTYDEGNDNAGMTFRDFAIVDDARNTLASAADARHGIYVIDGDDMLFDNIQFGFLTGTALKLGADPGDENISGVSSGRIRESDFRRIRIYRCGSGSPNVDAAHPDIPAFILQSGDPSEGDGSNQNYFHQLRFVYNEGRFLIEGRGGSGNSLRRSIFRDVQLHCLADNNNWVPEQWFPFDLVTIKGSVRETIFDGVMVNGNRAGTACWALVAHRDGALSTHTTQPKHVVLRNIDVVNVHGDLVRVERGNSVHLDGFGLGATAGDVIRVESSAAPDFQRASVQEWGINQVVAADTVNNSGTGQINRFYHGVAS